MLQHDLLVVQPPATTSHCRSGSCSTIRWRTEQRASAIFLEIQGLCRGQQRGHRNGKQKEHQKQKQKEKQQHRKAPLRRRTGDGQLPSRTGAAEHRVGGPEKPGCPAGMGERAADRGPR